MPSNAALNASRLSVAPMMDGNDFDAISDVCVVSCAVYVHVSIARFRAASWAFRSTGSDKVFGVFIR